MLRPPKSAPSGTFGGVIGGIPEYPLVKNPYILRCFGYLKFPLTRSNFPSIDVRIRPPAGVASSSRLPEARRGVGHETDGNDGRHAARIRSGLRSHDPRRGGGADRADPGVGPVPIAFRRRA